MKYLKNTFAKALILFAAVLVFASCKKDKVGPDQAAEPFDVRQYVIVTKELNSSGWVNNIRLTSFEAQSKCIIFTELGVIPDDGYTYGYDNGVLKLYYDLGLQYELKIEDKIITSNVSRRSFKLIKIPAENSLNGNTYAGGWKSEGSLLTTIASLKFTDTHYSEASINLPAPNKTYELFKNIAAYKYDVTDKVASLWLVLDGKLEGYRSFYNNNGNRVAGTFTKQ